MFIFSLSIPTAIFPDKLKIARVAPFFKVVIQGTRKLQIYISVTMFFKDS